MLLIIFSIHCASADDWVVDASISQTLLMLASKQTTKMIKCLESAADAKLPRAQPPSWPGDHLHPDTSSAELALPSVIC